MSARNPLFAAPPYPVENALKRLGANLRTARLRRNLTIQNVAEKIGTGPRAVADAEKGKPTTGIAVFAALLWAYDLVDQLAKVADPDMDEEGKVLASSKERSRAGTAEGLDDDF